MSKLQHQQLIVTPSGFHASAAGGVFPASGLVNMLGALDIEPVAVGSTVSRLKRNRVLVNHSSGDAAFHSLFEDMLDGQMTALLAEGMNTSFGMIGIYLVVVGIICVLMLNPDKTARSLQSRFVFNG